MTRTPEQQAAHREHNRRARERKRAGLGPVATSCAECGAAIAPPGPKGGKPRKWCSVRCENLANQYDACPGCGGRKKRVSERCTRCAVRSGPDLERRARIERLWAEGLPAKEIARREGWSGGAQATGARLAKLRKQGADLPYRYAAVRRRHGVAA